jgi:hypothetical protein
MKLLLRRREMITSAGLLYQRYIITRKHFMSEELKNSQAIIDRLVSLKPLNWTELAAYAGEIKADLYGSPRMFAASLYYGARYADKTGKRGDFWEPSDIRNRLNEVREWGSVIEAYSHAGYMLALPLFYRNKLSKGEQKDRHMELDRLFDVCTGVLDGYNAKRPDVPMIGDIIEEIVAQDAAKSGEKLDKRVRKTLHTLLFVNQKAARKRGQQLRQKMNWISSGPSS